MRTLTARPSHYILLTALATVVFGASCASGGRGIVQDDDRPPVVVSSGSVGFDPGAGSFERLGNSRNWRHKGISGKNAKPVRFDLSSVTGTDCSSTATFSATEMILYVSSTTSTENGQVKMSIKGKELRLEASRDMRLQGNHIRWDNWAMKSLVVTQGADLGQTCRRAAAATPISFSIEQKSK